MDQSVRTLSYAPNLSDGSHRRRRWWGLVLMLVAVFMVIMDSFIVNVALPAIQADLGASFAEVELVIAGYGLTYAVALITGGRLGDIYGRRRMLVVGLGAFTLASALCGLAPTPSGLILARLAQGMGAAVLFPQVFSLIRVTFADARERATAFAFLGVTQGLASIAGQILGGVIVELDPWGLGWRPVFLINLPIGILAMLVAARLIDESRSPTAGRLDPVGVVLSALGLSLLLYPLVEGREAGWPGWAFAALAASLPVLAAFALHQHRKSRRRASPLLETRLFHSRGFVVGVLLVLIFWSTLVSFFLALSFLLQAGLGRSPLAAAMIFLPIAVAYLLASLASGRLALRFGRAVLLVGASLATLSYLLMMGAARLAGGALDGPVLMPGLVLLGIGNGLLIPPLLNTIIGGVHAEDAGSASGMVSTVQQVGIAFGVAIVGVLFFGALGAARAAGADTATAYAQAFAAGILYNVAAAAVTLVLLLLLPRAAARRGA